MEFLKKYGYIFLYIAAAISFFTAALSKDRLMYTAIGMTQIAMGSMLLKNSKRA